MPQGLICGDFVSLSPGVTGHRKQMLIFPYSLRAKPFWCLYVKTNKQTSMDQFWVVNIFLKCRSLPLNINLNSPFNYPVFLLHKQLVSNCLWRFFCSTITCHFCFVTVVSTIIKSILPYFFVMAWSYLSMSY